MGTLLNTRFVHSTKRIEQSTENKSLPEGRQNQKDMFAMLLYHTSQEKTTTFTNAI